MDRMRGYSNLGARFGASDDAARERALRALAERAVPRGRRRLRLGADCAAALRRALGRLREFGDGGDEALSRLRSDAGRIEGCLRVARAESGASAPAVGREPRVLALARVLVGGGERLLTRERLEREVALFDSARSLEMREIQLIPAALRIALCEALRGVAEDALRVADARAAADAWVRGGGAGRVRSDCDEAFFERALQLSVELERPELHARIERAIARLGQRREWLVERAHRIEADNCLRLDNLMKLAHLLDGLNWRRCFDALCTAEQELRDDPARVYGAMDSASRARVRTEVEAIARRAKAEEIVVVRLALRAARRAMDERGGDDPRSTVCWYLWEDEGRAALCRELGARPPRRRVPDPSGRGSALLAAGLVAVALLLCLWGIGEPALMVCALPLAWVNAWRVLGRFYPWFVKPGALLRMKVEAVPDDARTLVALPVLLSGESRAREMVGRLEALGCLERDGNIDYLLLGDFRDGDSPHEPDDDAVLRAAREGVAKLNAAAGREKYFYLHRARSLRARDGRWMGENRKRGALMALNRLLLGREGAVEAFGAEGSRAAALIGRYRYVVTLDADTEYLPGTLQKLIGAMAHPLNRARESVRGRRGYAVLQPDMRLTAEASLNAWVELTAGRGGVDGYPGSASDFYQDVTGRGCFAGKGIYDVRAFAEATEGRLDDGNILSHDLIEGILAGAGLLGDVRFYDGCPQDLSAELQRLHRWTRGDWQLLPVLFSKIKMGAADRMKLLGNLLRSLYAPALLVLLIGAVWLDAPGAFALGLVVAFLDPALRPGRGAGRAWRAALLQLATLPATAFCQADAILRTLWRLAVSKKHLMEWVTAADASGSNRRARLPGRVAALLVLPGLLRGQWIVPVLGIAALFWVGADWAGDLSRQVAGARRPLKPGQAALLQELARRTWHFFETYVPEGGPGLPPDNVQLDPDLGPAMRTSPTNVGLYLMSCLAARELGFLPDAAMRARIASTVATLEGLEKWRGQLYNWYDISTLEPLRPRYVSAVDSGNLAGALLLCAHALGEGDPALSARLRALAEGMDLAALYDGERKLFCIGMDVENGRMSESHYDLYASEARILSFAAMMLGQVPAKHWSRLNRASVRAGKRGALLSWSGTMFEYLMPELLLRSPANSLAGRTREAVAACQIRQGRRLGRPWGISESGFYAFDRQLNYQYRAFGLRALALSGEAEEGVVAPYASALALCCEPGAAAENLRRMCALGWSGEFGMFESADYARAEGDEGPRLVRSHMAHHQGMTLCAICEALGDGALARTFMDIPEVRALRLLLHERPGDRPARRRARQERPRREVRRAEMGYARGGRAEGRAADVQLLRGAGTTALVTARGAAFAWSEGLQLNRFSGDLTNPHEGIYVHIGDEASGACAVIGQSGRASFDAGIARFREEFEGLNVELKLCASPEDGALYQAVEIENPGGEARELSVTGCLAAALAPERDMRAHPAFQNLFVEGEQLSPRALALRRRPRERGRELPEMIYLVSGGDAPRGEMRLDALVGRTGSLGIPGRLCPAFDGGEGALLNPCAALRVRVEVEPKSTARLHFALLLAPRGEREARAGRAMAEDAAARAARLAMAQSRTALVHAGLDGARHALYQRAAALLFDAKLRRDVAGGARAWDPADRRMLWGAGVSGELPLILVELTGGDLSCAREGLRLHAFYRSMGVAADFVLLDARGGDYRRNAGGELGALLASSHLAGMENAPGGAHALELCEANAPVAEALRRTAAIHLKEGAAPLSQLREALDALKLRQGEAYAPMPAAELPAPEGLLFFNGFGGVAGEEYRIALRGGKLPPAPWCNVVASERAGAILSERGGGFAWHGNSRSDRLTPFANDALREGWGWMFYLVDMREKKYLRLLPGDAPMTDFDVRFAPGRCAWAGRTEGIAFEVRARAVGDGLLFEIELSSESDRARELTLAGFVDWRMGTDAADDAMLRTWSRFGACFASGAAEGVGLFASDAPAAAPGCDRLTLFSGGDAMTPRGFGYLDAADGGWTLRAPVRLEPGGTGRWRFLLGSAPGVPEAYALARQFRAGGEPKGGTDWEELLGALKIETPDAALNFLANGFLQAQALDARVRGRTGLYQPGGAYGFRDQLQDVAALLHYDPARARRHLLRCAAKQFEDGDVLHWWHEPATGVRTRVSDDLLFLPWAAAKYVEVTGDAAVLADSAPYLENIEIPEGREDVYAEMRMSTRCTSLHGHCMRALRRAAETGPHGLCRMGGGDWNDGMNRVGGESVWLTEFLAVVAADYARVAPDEGDRAWLTALNERLCAALEQSAWDGEWYLRAYAADGRKLGGRECDECQIDLISQAWATLAELDAERCGCALDAAWSRLVDEKLGIVRLLDPPFDGGDFDPGYIAAYPPGVRENGAQYTHAACWLIAALARRGDAARAHRTLQMLLPLNHALDERAAERYRVEPYVMAGDVDANPGFAGRGGWTWYTGSAAWMLMAILELLGYEHRGEKVRLRALLGEWNEVEVTVRFGASHYRLACRRGVEKITLDGEAFDGEFIEMRDDGREHLALFPPREVRQNITQKNLKGWETVL